MEKNPTSTFKIGGILRKKMFRKFVETSVIISLEKDNSPYIEKNFKNFFNWKKIHLQFSKVGVFWIQKRKGKGKIKRKRKKRKMEKEKMEKEKQNEKGKEKKKENENKIKNKKKKKKK